MKMSRPRAAGMSPKPDSGYSEWTLTGLRPSAEEVVPCTTRAGPAVNGSVTARHGPSAVTWSLCSLSLSHRARRSGVIRSRNPGRTSPTLSRVGVEMEVLLPRLRKGYPRPPRGQSRLSLLPAVQELPKDPLAATSPNDPRRDGRATACSPREGAEAQGVARMREGPLRSEMTRFLQVVGRSSACSRIAHESICERR